MWTFLVFCSETWLAITWARYVVFPIDVGWYFGFLMILELIVFLDIISEFFQAYKEKGMEHYVMQFEKIWRRYLYSQEFLQRALTFIPWGIIGELLPQPNLFKLLWIIRATKISMSLEILGPRFISRLLLAQ